MQFQLLSLFALLALAAAVPVTPPIERCTEADEGQICNAGEINGFYVTGTCTEIEFAGQYACIPGGTLGGQQPASNDK
ncbi:hypothetical protein LSUE1_G007614 [Lachnellula suecica]|uniref:Uncharacterized protein n=1 Tax=Lachnellula suecica TaxID=602035 RepID=A0A8T9BZY6_9HELO|nr:hypothetical protein LSUE1_G007614 [Lachnellula suecica]